MADLKQIMTEERDITVDRLAASSLPARAIEDSAILCGVIMIAINEFIAALDRPVHEDVTPLALRAMADEHERIMRRLRDAGLAEPRAS